VKITAKNLSRAFNVGSSRIGAVNDVSFEIDDPEVIAIIGPSGSGKSTLLNLIGLNDRPTSGEILIDDINPWQLSDGERRSIRRLRMGFIFQTFNLLPTLDAAENVEIPMAFTRKTQIEQRQRALHLLDSVGLRHRTRHRPRQLSMGEMQRVAIARALANQPETIIADEPTGELDSKTGQDILSLLFDINRKEKTLIIVATHDDKIVKAADRIYAIQDGNLNMNTQRVLEKTKIC
jgi:putative ABC transport system ATP-binding protein